MDNKVCRNCGSELKGESKCPYCGTVNFKDPVEYSDFTTSKINTKKIIIVSAILLIIAIIIIIISLFFGIHEDVVEYDSYETEYQKIKNKCDNAQSCDGQTCIYINEVGEEETINCSSNTWYNKE